MSDFVFVTKQSRKTTAALRKEQRVAKTKESERLVEALHAGIEPPPLGISLVPGEDPEETLYIPGACVGMVIGKKGENLKRIQERFKVTVSIKDGEPGEDKHVVVSGERRSDVRAAVRELDYAVESLEVPPGATGWVVGKGGRHLKFVQDLTGAAALHLRREGEEDLPKGAGKGKKAGEAPPDQSAADATAAPEAKADAAGEPEAQAWVDIKGQRANVANARICIEAHMSYHPVFLEMDEVERKLDEEIIALRARIGRRAGEAPRTPGAGVPGSEARRADRATSPERSGKGGKGRDRGADGEEAASKGPSSSGPAPGGGSSRGRGRGAKQDSRSTGAS